ncbi:hypothetical protein NE619_04510 [Anaerovorax odorimutans]|uniref:Uncharacterized protein n=1 Tax=Anaerovorax odorimutans TaxID=109327 RepID=A0ABT1RLB0_9FIRM|nr:hypothetical protein [Anaerovorax odorimutans]MCQ4635979.1 hypothetical protein [Anaerovorax odorimutans]
MVEQKLKQYADLNRSNGLQSLEIHQQRIQNEPDVEQICILLKNLRLGCLLPVNGGEIYPENQNLVATPQLFPAVTALYGTEY